MIERYSTPAMQKIWGEENKFYYWLKVEVEVLKARKKLGEISCDIPENLLETIKIDPKEINRIEKEITKHDVKAFLDFITPQFPDELKPFLHKGLTSYDIGDTTFGLQLKDSLKIIMDGCYELMISLRYQAVAHRNTVMVGRTHGVHAEPITYGVKLAIWYSELKRRQDRLIEISKQSSFGKISGAVGVYTIDPAIEKIVCENLGLTPTPSTQIIPRDIMTDYIAALVNLGGVISKISTNFRLLAQTEICEVMEYFSKGQTGSSAMPHKKNPVSLEQITSLMRMMPSYFIAAFENQANCWHERSLDNSACERIIFPDASSLIDYALKRMINIVDNLQIFPEKMKENLDLTSGLVFSQEVMMMLADKGMPREKAHSLVKNIALYCWENKTNFFEALYSHSEVTEIIKDRAELYSCFAIEDKLKHIDYIFEQIFDGY